jgi:hypothetical protein
VCSLRRILLQSLVSAANHSDGSTHCCSSSRTFGRIAGDRTPYRSKRSAAAGTSYDMTLRSLISGLRRRISSRGNRSGDRCLRNNFARVKSSPTNHPTTKIGTIPALLSLALTLRSTRRDVVGLRYVCKDWKGNHHDQQKETHSR